MSSEDDLKALMAKAAELERRVLELEKRLKNLRDYGV